MLPAVASISVMPGRSTPRASASSTIAFAMRSFTEPPGLRCSHLTTPAPGSDPAPPLRPPPFTLLPPELARVVVVDGGRPQELHRRAGQRERQRRGAQVRPHRADLAGDQRRHGAEQRAAVEQRAQAGKARHRAADRSGLLQHVLDDTAQVAVVRHDHVIVREVAGLGEAPLDPGVARIEQADEAAVEQRLSADRRGQLVGDRDRHVEAAAGQRRGDGAELHRGRDQAHARRRARQDAQQRRQQPRLGHVGDAQPQGPRARRRLEVSRRQRGVDQRAQVRLDARAQTLTARGQGQATTLAGEQRRADRGGEPTQRRADGGLGEIEPPGRAGDAALLGDHREDPQQVEVEIPSITGAHVSHPSYSLERCDGQP